jgi:conjugative relaxase-like TrwC/TraI family protein
MVRFDKPCVLVTRAVEYYREHMVVGDYLTQEGQAEMTWVGAGAERLGLAGRCRLEDFERVAAGRHPATGEKLMVQDKGAQRRVCFFGQISPPKDVSVLHLVGGDQRIGQWWQEAIRETLHEMEALTATRVRRAGQNADRRTGSMVAAVVTHDANRALDPQLHTHVCAMNLTYDEAEARWKSVQPSGYYRHQGYLREVCYNKLAGRMIAAGYQLEPGRRIGFAVKGVPDELRLLFSKRRHEILRQATECGARSQDALQAVTAHSRAEKTKATAATLRAGWVKEAGPHLEALQKVIAETAGRLATISPITPKEAVQSAEAHVFERKSVVDDRLLLREALIAGRGQVTLAALKRTLGNRERSGELIRAGEELASRDGFEAEREFTGWANRQLRRHPRLGTVPATKGLGPDQRAAVRELLASTSGVVILQGDAGTGKTTCLKTVVAGIENAGGTVFACAPSAGATEVLRQELTPDADTLQQFLANEVIQRASRGRVLLLDEAGLVSVRQMRDLCRLAARNDNRLLLVGDFKQHGSIEAGDALRCLQEFARVPVVHLKEIRRQQDSEYRKAVARLAKGDAFGAFNQFSRLGAVHEVVKEPALFAAAADDYVRTVRAGKSCLAISPVWAEIHAFTTAVRGQMRAAGLLSGADRTFTVIEPFKWTQEERRRIQNYRPGDVLTFHREFGNYRKFDSVVVARLEDRMLVVCDAIGSELRLDPRRASGFGVATANEINVATGDRLLIRANTKPAGLRNGDLVDVARVDQDGAIALKDGRTVPAWFREFCHGYAATSHAAQGKTVDRGILLMGEAGIAAGNLKQAYVSNSRFRESQAIYTVDKAEAREAMMRPADRRLATEAVGETAELPRRRWRDQWRKSISQGIAA